MVLRHKLRSFFPALLCAASASPFLSKPQLFPRATCSGNTATTRSEWCDYSIDTDYTSTAPDTGVTREYYLELTDVTVAPDGVSRSAMAVNGTIPGPTLFADWGDTVVVHVTNSLTTSENGTSIHFHGIRQNYTNEMDGVSSITQCPTAPGESITYTWKAVQYGSTWYHSHFALQAWEGIFGGICWKLSIIINGPATADYDEDLGMLFLNDWSHQTVDELYISAETSGPPTLDNGLINGTNVYDDTGYRYNVSFTSDTSYRIRLVNAAVDTHFKFMIDNHTMQVIAADLVPIEPYNTTFLDIGMGQRYDIIVTADQASVADNFWMRAIPQSACSENDNEDNIRGIVYYGSSPSTPSTSAYSYTDSCDDETDNITPYLSKTVSSETYEAEEEATVVNNITSFNTSNAVIELSEADEWAYVVIETTLAVPHPIHLHGHDFYILAQGSGTYSSSTTLNLDNPPRRDTAMLPSSGYLVLAFQTDNPGAWLMHCHIGWHTSEGFALQFIERYDEISALTNSTTLESNCDAWSSFQTSAGIEQDDSGV
ncbi:multicopper oxidase [Zopfia rhizophila CBS 207.26]|uniref:Multicopper oxidase n=1 Tax=Zopfia rhizophila CBS 207.26 TaxID=1314779 RepID=A0A6A6EMK8_9PEZI|nr:multicopper oxidase [Zopfia rhizophila CBS 207.26]